MLRRTNGQDDALEAAIKAGAKIDARPAGGMGLWKCAMRCFVERKEETAPQPTPAATELTSEPVPQVPPPPTSGDPPVTGRNIIADFAENDWTVSSGGKKVGYAPPPNLTRLHLTRFEFWTQVMRNTYDSFSGCAGDDISGPTEALTLSFTANGNRKVVVGVAGAHSLLSLHRQRPCKAWGLDLYTGDLRVSPNAADEPGTATPFLPDPEEDVLSGKVVMVRLRVQDGSRVLEAKVGGGGWVASSAVVPGEVRPRVLSQGSYVVTLVKVER